MDFSNIDIKELACFIYEHLKNNGIHTILVGGACVSIINAIKACGLELEFRAST
jgi:hypothetical protein